LAGENTETLAAFENKANCPNQPIYLLGVEFMTGAAGQQRISPDFVANFIAPVPPIGEQESITCFLASLYHFRIDMQHNIVNHPSKSDQLRGDCHGSTESGD
jgi:hypothetical protein